MGEFDGLQLVGESKEELTFIEPNQTQAPSTEFVGLPEVGYDPARANVKAVKDQKLGADSEALAHDNSKKHDVPLSVARDQPDQFDADFDGWEQSSPEVKRHISKSANNTAVSRGDFANLGFLDRVLKGVPATYASGKLSNDVADLRWRQLMGEDSPELTASIETLKAQRQPTVEGEGFFERGILGVGEQANLLLRTFGAGIKTGVPAAGGAFVLGQLGPQVGLPEEIITVPAAFSLGSKIGAAKEIFKLESAGAYDEFLDIRDVNGQPIDRDILRIASFGVGTANTGLELIGLGALLKTVPGGAKILGMITKSQIKKLLTRQTVRSALKEIAKRFVGAVTAETVTEMGQEAVNIFAAELMKGRSAKTEGTFFKPFDVGAAKERLAEIGKRTFETTTILAGLPSATNIITTTATGVKSREWSVSQGQVNDAVNKTLTKQKSADHVEGILNEYGLDKPAYVAPSFYQTVPDAEAMLESVGVDTDTSRSASIMGQDVEINLAKAHAQLSAEEFFSMLGHMKETSDSYTKQELDAQVDADDIDNITKLQEGIAKQDKAVGAEIARITEETAKAEETKEVTENVPVLMKGLADRLTLEGVDPVEFLKKIKVQKVPFITRLAQKGKELLQERVVPQEEKGFFKQAAGAVKDLITGQKREDVSQVSERDTGKPLSERLELTDKQFDDFFQAQKREPPRGAIPMSNESHLISLFETSNQSTLLHETAHIALKEYEALENAGQASESLVSDMKAARQWLGAEEGQPLTREQSEQFARGFEAYLMEGKAPNQELRSVFARFQRWLTSVYKTAKSLNVKLDNNIRGVFDRMLNANIEVENAAANGGFVELTPELVNNLGIIKEDENFMKRAIKAAIEIATRKLTQKRNLEYRKNLKQWTVEATAEVQEENANYDTMQDIIDTKFFIDRDEFIDRFGEDVARRLPNKNILKKDSNDVDSVAIFYEFTDGQEMAESFVATPPFNEAVEQRVNEKRARHDAQYSATDFLTDLKPYRDYLDILSKYLKTNLSESDLSAREKKLLTRSALKAAARQTINTMSIREARRVDKFLSAMKKAASDQRRAVIKKDWAAASRANELVNFNYEMASQSVKIRNEVDKVIKRSKKTARSKTIDFEQSEAIKHLTTKFGLATTLPQDPAKTPNYDKLFKGEYSETDLDAPATPNDGYIAPDFLTDNTISDYRDLSIEQLDDLNSAIQYLAGQGRKDKDQFISTGEELEADIVFPAAEVMDKVKPLKKWEKGSLMRTLSDTTRGLFARLDALTFQAKALDGYTNLGKDGVKGIVERFIIDPIKRQNNAKIEHKAKLDSMMEPHLKQIRKTLRKWGRSDTGNIQIDGAPLPLQLINDGQTKGWFGRQLFAIALNTGNESNLARLQDGYNLSDANIQAIKDFLSKEDWKAIQGIWDAINTLFDDTSKVHKRIKNYGLTKIDAVPVRTKHGVFKGGYYPAKYDPNLDFGVEDRGAVADLFAKDDATFVTPFAKSGHTQKRVSGVALPMLLDLSVIGSHIDDALQYIYFAETIKDSDRIQRHPVFRDAAIRIIGKPSYKSIRKSLKGVVDKRRTGMDLPAARTIEWAKGLATASILAHNTGVAIKQPLSTFGAIRDIGFKSYVDGFSSVLMSPMQHYEMMIEKSTYMKDRLKNFDRELQRSFQKLNGKQRALYFGDSAVTWDDVVNFGFWQIRAADTVTVLPIWHGAYQDKLNADQSNLQEAIEYADDSVRNSQPSAQALDFSSWQRDGGAIRLFSLFQTFTVGKYGQRQRLFYKAWRNGSIKTKDYAWFNFMDAFVPLVAINMLQALIWGRDVDDEEVQRDLLLNIFGNWALMGVPFANNLINALNFGSPIQSPVLKTTEQVWNSMKAVGGGLDGFENKKERERALWGLANIVSILSRVPLTKVVAKAEKGAKAKDAAPLIKYLVPPPKGK